jgi:geranylgeranyl pyrophosphate synthase
MTREAVRSWLEARTPVPPEALARKLAECVEAAPESALAGDSVAEVAGRLGVATLRRVVQRQGVAYDGAMDLLVADAFVTYAFEAAAEEGADTIGLVRRVLAEVAA